MGVTDVKVIAAWSQVENTYSGEVTFDPVPVLGYVEQACAAGMHVRVGIDTISGEPYSFFANNANSQLIDATGHVDNQYLQTSFWMPGQRAAIHKVASYLISQFANDTHIPAGCIDEMGPSYGTAGENLYPSSGYTQAAGYGNPSFWAYDLNAQADFTAKMQAKYETIATANAAWGTSFSSFPGPPKPAGTNGAAYTPTSALWTDFLYWYRNEKRDFAAWQVQDTLQLLKSYYPTNTPAFAIPIAGNHLTPEQFNLSVSNRGATDAVSDDAIVSFIDTEFWVDLAHANAQYGVALHLTSLPNNPEGSYVKTYELAHYGSPMIMSGENNGHDNAPMEMTNNTQSLNLFQTDVVDDSDLFGFDHVTPSANYTAFQSAFLAVASQMAGNAPYKQTYTQSDYAYILTAGNCINVDPAGMVKSCLSTQGQFQVFKNNLVVWTSNMSPSTYNCATGVPYNESCAVYFVGRLFETDNHNNQIWNTGNADPNSSNLLIFTTAAPYMHIEDGAGNTVWTTGLTQ